MYEKDKRSFFEKLTGTINIEDEENNVPIGEEKPEHIQIHDQNEEEKIPASVSINQYEKETIEEVEEEKEEEEEEVEKLKVEEEPKIKNRREEEKEVAEEKEEDGELAVDIYEKENEIFVQAMIAGVEAKDMDVSITRDTVIIRGSRQNMAEVPDKNYYNKELYWGKFSRKILLPEEIDPEKSEAIEKHGLLILRMPKLNEKKVQKLEVKAL